MSGSVKRNYQNELDELLCELYGADAVKAGAVFDNAVKKSLLLHACCAPCSSYVTEYLHGFFDITILFYNPNITEESEYIKRKEELKRYLSEVSYGSEIKMIDADYEPGVYLKNVKGLEKEPERGARCRVCFYLRLLKTAVMASGLGVDYFCTTLSISPHKDADLLMSIGEELSSEYGIAYLPSDFKKRGGYQRSIELSREYGLYRQDFCGCIFSKNQKNLKISE